MFQIRKNRQWEDPSIRLFTCSSMFHNTRDPEATPSQARYDWTLQDHLHQKCLEHITFDRRVADGSIGTGKLCSRHSLNHSCTSLNGATGGTWRTYSSSTPCMEALPGIPASSASEVLPIFYLFTQPDPKHSDRRSPTLPCVADHRPRVKRSGVIWPGGRGTK